jgi:hypothetical protein
MPLLSLGLMTAAAMKGVVLGAALGALLVGGAMCACAGRRAGERRTGGAAPQSSS